VDRDRSRDDGGGIHLRGRDWAGLADVEGWTSAGIETSVSRDDLTLVPGTIYYVSVKARNPSQRWSEIGVSQGIEVIPARIVGSIGELGALEEGVDVMLAGKVVTAVFGDWRVRRGAGPLWRVCVA